MRLSYSKLSTFERCPFVYKKIYMERVKQQPKKYFSFGHSIHKTLEKFYCAPLLYGLGLKKPTKKYLLKILERHWVRDGFLPGEDGAYLARAREILENYFDSFIEDAFTPAWAVEAPFSFHVGGHEVTGFIDRIQRSGDSFEIIDYKTNRRVPSYGVLKGNLQLKIYFAACRKYFRMHVSSVSYIFLRQGKKVSFDAGDLDLAQIEDNISSIAGRIAAERRFEPRRNIFCRSCDFRSECGMFYR